MKKILITYRLLEEGVKELYNNYEIYMPKDKSTFTKEEVIDMIPDFDVLVPNFTFYTDNQIIDKAHKLKLISNYGVGYNNIDVEYATQKNIVVTNTPQSVLEPTAEFAFGLLLDASRRISYYDRKIRDNNISWGLHRDAGLSIFGKTLGIIGMGRIGQAIARRAVASGMNIIYYNRTKLDPSIEKLYNATYTSFNDLISNSDYISLNAPSTSETHHLIGESQFKKMKSSAIFVNTSRGSLVDEKALVNALKKGYIFAAALDVFENEPNITSELLTLDNVVLAPHAGTKTIDARISMSKEMSRNIIGFFENKYNISRVN